MWDLNSNQAVQVAQVTFFSQLNINRQNHTFSFLICHEFVEFVTKHLKSNNVYEESSIQFQHDAPIKTIHWVKAPNYTCVMTGSWDRTLKGGV